MSEDCGITQTRTRLLSSPVRQILLRADRSNTQQRPSSTSPKKGYPAQLQTVTSRHTHCKQGCFTDFPFPDDTPSHCTAGHVQKYLEDYVEHFNLTSRLRLSTIVTGVHRDDEHDRWIVDVEGSGPEYFDKVIIASGINSRPHVPKLEGLEQFEGEVLHSRAFKRYVFTC